MEGEIEEVSGKDGEGGSKSKSGKKLSLEMILVLANTLGVIAALGTFVYTKVLYEKPPIIETDELEKKKEELKTPAIPQEKEIVKFDQIQMINIAMSEGKSHFATVHISVECRDSSIAGLIQAKKTILIDKFISLIGKKHFRELNSIQGKLIFKNELIREFTVLLGPEVGAAPITDLFFSDFILK